MFKSCSRHKEGPLVKGLRHRLFTAVTRVRIPYGLFYLFFKMVEEDYLVFFFGFVSIFSSWDST